jgi:SAM-dependent methyltransferase
MVADVKLNLAAGDHTLVGFKNLDPAYGEGWTFETGLPFLDDSIDAITESHGLMYVELDKWEFVFSEIHRVLRIGGVVRVTEDSTLDRNSARYGGHHDRVTLTSPELVAAYMIGAGLQPQRMTADTTLFEDDSLLQSWHGKPPKVFYVEGVKT